MTELCQPLGTASASLKKPPTGGGSGIKQRVGVKLQTGSGFVGNTYSSAKVWLKKETGSPDLNLNVSIYHDGTTLPIHTFQTISTSTITDGFLEYTLTGGGDYTIVANDILAVNWESESYILYTYEYGSSVTGLPQMRYNEWDQSTPSWTTNSQSFRFCLSSGAAPSTGTRLPPPPIVLGGL